MARQKEPVPVDVLEFLRRQAVRGGYEAAKRMTKAQRVARAKKAARASAKVRSRRARERRKR